MYSGFRKVFGKKYSSKIIKQQFKRVDWNNSGIIQVLDFTAACIDKKIFMSDKSLKYIFNQIDDDKNGYLDYFELKCFTDIRMGDDYFTSYMK